MYLLLLGLILLLFHRLRKIFNMGGGAQTTASEASRPSACGRRSRGSGGWPLAGDARGQCPFA